MRKIKINKSTFICILITVLIFSTIYLLLLWLQEKQQANQLLSFDFNNITDSHLSPKERLSQIYLAAKAARLHPYGTFAEALHQFETDETAMLRTLQQTTLHDSIENMVFVPKGNFLYGGFGRFKDNPKDTALSAYYIDKYLVTNLEFVKFLNDSGNRIDHGVYWYNTLLGRIDSTEHGYIVEKGYENHPVVAVTWYGAQAYSKSIGKRLPTKEEWEKAARGIYGRLYPWGSEFNWQKCNSACYWLQRNLNQQEWENWFKKGDKSGITTTPVDAFPQGVSPFGCYDMAGNVWQWTSNSYVGRLRKTPRKINRGGNFLYGPNEVQCPHRGIGRPGQASVIVGFRCVKDIK